MSALTRLDASAIAADVANRRRSAVTVIQDILERIALYDAIQPQAWIARFDAQTLLASFEAALTAAERAVVTASA